MDTKYIILFFIIVISMFFLNTISNNTISNNTISNNTISNNTIENFNSPSDTSEIHSLQLDENREKYQEFQEIQEKILDTYNFQIGYNSIDNTNSNSIGVCPLGKYYVGEFEKDKIDFKKCKDCTKCNKGYYLKHGCSGNTDSICEAEKVPHNIFMNSHTKGSKIHNVINPHQHPYGYFINNESKQNHKLSSIKHNHL